MTIERDFELIREQKITELNTTARLYRHIETGAQLLSLENDDENKVFGITFRTPPSDSTGVAHIMEHSVLCGSRKYPVKEPFVQLMKGSLNTFLNAFTFADKTCYPVASQNEQDFYNLVDVYLDAVFFPRLSPYAFMQEGWHYELEDPQAEITYKGIVFNEMKGAYSDPNSVLSDEIQYSLFPDNTYRHDSGGNPTAIPDLTYKQFRDFHSTYYHPSNALIYFYGDDNPEARLSVVHEYLHMFEAAPIDSEIALQKPFTEPRRVESAYEITEGTQDAKSYLTVNWLLPETGDAELVLGLWILEQALIGTPASPLRKALIDSGLGEDLTGRGMETSMRQVFFSTGLKGVTEENLPAAENLIQKTLADLSLRGVDKDSIAAAINTIEFRLRENNTGSFPRGLAIMLWSIDFWLYGKDPLAPLTFEAPLNAIKARLAAGDPFFEHLIEAYLVNNTSRSTVILRPDPDLAGKREAAERQRLEKARAAMTDQQVAQVVEDTRELKLRQETPDSPEMLMTIPTLDLGDLPAEIRRIPTEAHQSGDCQVLFHDLFTNGILYLDLGFNLRVLPQDLIPYLPLFGRALLETGTTQESFVQLLQRIGRNTGGIHTTTLTSAVRGNDGASVSDYTAWLFLRGKAMTNQAGELLTILNEILIGANLEDRERFRQMALEEKARLESRLAGAGSRLVNSRLRARYNLADWASEQMGGVSYLFFLRNLAQQIDQDWPSVLQSLQSIRSLLISSANALCNITLDAQAWATIQPQVTRFLAALPAQKGSLVTWTLPKLPDAEGLTIPSQVNFVGKGGDLFHEGYKLTGSSFVVNKYLNDTWLWDKVRVVGGAYGGFAVFDSQSGVFDYLSNRDPNLKETLQAYDQSSDYLKTLEVDEAELAKAIIGTVGDLDAYLLPDAKGFTAMRWFLTGTTDKERQRLRDEVLATSGEDFHRFGQALEKIKDRAAVVVLGVDEAIHNAGLFDDIKKVL